MTIPAVTFDYNAWVAAFPAFANISPTDAQSYFDGASVFCANDTCSPTWGVQVAQGSGQVPLLGRLLWLLTCHLAFLGAFRDASGNPSSTGTTPPSPIVGRVSSAAEGSVNVSTELDVTGYPVPGFFQQTPWGLQYWQATSQMRQALYVPNPTVVFGAAYPSLPFASRRGIGWR
jgi:hypothetical protein